MFGLVVDFCFVWVIRFCFVWLVCFVLFGRFGWFVLFGLAGFVWQFWFGRFGLVGLVWQVWFYIVFKLCIFFISSRS